jgi:hypothetical protein
MTGAVIGKRLWAIAEGYIPSASTGESRELTSHETLCVLNAGDQDARLSITVFFADREPAGPFLFTVPARRTRHLRFNDFAEPQRIPRDTDFASIIESDAPVVIQHTRLDSRQSALALMSTVAYSG